MSSVTHFYGTAAEMALRNPRVPKGALAGESDTGVIKVGDGATRYNSLSTVLTGTYARERDPFRVVPVATRLASLGGPAGTGLSNGTNTGSNMVIRHTVLVACTGVRFVFGNFRSVDTPPNEAPNAITVTAGASLATYAGASSTYRVTFNGQNSVVIQPGCYAISDALPFDCIAGNFIFSKTYVVVSSGEKWPLALNVRSGNSDTVDRGTSTSDLSKTNGVVNATGAGYSPFLVIGVPAPSVGRKPVVAIEGDSIAFGVGSTEGDQGFILDALETASMQYIQLAAQGQQANNFQNPLSTAVRGAFLGSATHAIEQNGVNDLSASRTLAQLQASVLAIWKRNVARGIKTWRTTLLPYTTSTDSWATVGNQTVSAFEANRTAFNDWIRAGAPIAADASAAVAIGTSGALLTGATGHPLSGYFETADAVETARNSGKWITTGAANFYTSDGVHPKTTANALLAATVNTALFTVT